MKCKILIDATTIENKKDGLSQYIIALINHLPEPSFELFEYTILINPGIQREELAAARQSGKFIFLTKKIRPIGPKREWDMCWFLLRYRNKFDLIHSTSNQYPLFLKNGIATVHDITFAQYLDARWWTFNLAKKYLNCIVGHALRRSDAVIAVSEATKNGLISHYNTHHSLRNKIKVIYEGWEHLLPGKRDLNTSGEAYASGPYLFYIGSSRLHKNLPGLIKGFMLAREQVSTDIKLVISGDKQHIGTEDEKNVAAINKNGEKIIFTGFVSDALLEGFFKNADAFIFPSLNEGFGIPVLESFFFNKPLLCSNTSSLPEIAGDAALYFDPLNAADIARAIVFFYNNPAVWPLLIEKGRQRLALFSWKKTGEETVALYKEVLRKRALKEK
jgi:glycosyltransferase involved in cell wall biosynthesis